MAGGEGGLVASSFDCQVMQNLVVGVERASRCSRIRCRASNVAQTGIIEEVKAR